MEREMHFMQTHINGVICLTMLTFAAVCLLCGPAGSSTIKED